MGEDKGGLVGQGDLQLGLAGDRGHEGLVVMHQHPVLALLEQRVEQHLAGGGRALEAAHQRPHDRPHAAQLGALDHRLGDGVAHAGGAALGDGGQDVLLAAEVLIEGADADPGPFGDVVGGQPVDAVGLEKLKGRVEDRVDRRFRTGLARGSALSFRHLRPFVRHIPPAPGRRVGT